MHKGHITGQSRLGITQGIADVNRLDQSIAFNDALDVFGLGPASIAPAFLIDKMRLQPAEFVKQLDIT